MASLIRLTLHRFGRNRVFVLLLAWLTLWPTWAPLPVNSQRRAISLLQTQKSWKEAARIRAKALEGQALRKNSAAIATLRRPFHFGAQSKRCRSKIDGGGLTGGSGLVASLPRLTRYCANILEQIRKIERSAIRTWSVPEGEHFLNRAAYFERFRV